MDATNAYPAELPLAQDTLNWPELLIFGLAVLIITALAIIAPRRRGRMMMVTDVLEK